MDQASNLMHSKKKSTKRIDGIVAAVMGLGRTLLNKGELNPSVYVMEWY